MAAEKNLVDLIGTSTQASVTDRLYQRISGLILSGELEEGYTFPNETELCEQLHVGRTSLREAYKALELSGYVSRSKRGTVVNSQSAIVNATPLKTLFQSASHADFTQFRMMIESWSARLAAENASLSDVEKLEELMERMKKAQQEGNFRELMEQDQQFHLSIAHMSGNSLISTVVTIMDEEWRAGIRRNFEAAIAEGRTQVFCDTIVRHQAIVEAIRTRNISAAARMEEHIRAAAY